MEGKCKSAMMPIYISSHENKKKRRDKEMTEDEDIRQQQTRRECGNMHIDENKKNFFPKICH